MKMIISFILSVTLVLFITAVISYFFFLHDNRKEVDIFVDINGTILINGVESTELEATLLINDPAYIPILRYHPESSIHYCFGQCR
jgi:hypothetical protein